jgi:hypothetical protein
MRPHYALSTSLNVLNFGASGKGIYASELRILNIRTSKTNFLLKLACLAALIVMQEPGSVQPVKE